MVNLGTSGVFFGLGDTPTIFPLNVAFTLLYTDSFFSSMCISSNAAMAHTAVTA